MLYAIQKEPSYLLIVYGRGGYGYIVKVGWGQGSCKILEYPTPQYIFGTFP